MRLWFENFKVILLTVLNYPKYHHHGNINTKKNYLDNIVIALEFLEMRFD